MTSGPAKWRRRTTNGLCSEKPIGAYYSQLKTRLNSWLAFCQCRNLLFVPGGGRGRREERQKRGCWFVPHSSPPSRNTSILLILTSLGASLHGIFRYDFSWDIQVVFRGIFGLYFDEILGLSSPEILGLSSRGLLGRSSHGIFRLAFRGIFGLSSKEILGLSSRAIVGFRGILRLPFRGIFWLSTYGIPRLSSHRILTLSCRGICRLFSLRLFELFSHGIFVLSSRRKFVLLSHVNSGCFCTANTVLLFPWKIRLVLSWGNLKFF